MDMSSKGTLRSISSGKDTYSHRGHTFASYVGLPTPPAIHLIGDAALHQVGGDFAQRDQWQCIVVR